MRYDYLPVVANKHYIYVAIYEHDQVQSQGRGDGALRNEL